MATKQQKKFLKGGRGHQKVTSFLRGGHQKVTSGDKAGGGGLKNFKMEVTSFMDGPKWIGICPGLWTMPKIF